MKVEKLDHIHVYVKNLDSAIRFFSDLLGANFSDIIDDEASQMRSAINPLGLELIESASPETVVARFIEARGEGLAAISLKVPNIEEAMAELESKGLRLVGRVEVGKIKEAQFHPKDSHGVMIELCEYEELHGAARSALST